MVPNWQNFLDISFFKKPVVSMKYQFFPGFPCQRHLGCYLLVTEGSLEDTWLIRVMGHDGHELHFGPCRFNPIAKFYWRFRCLPLFLLRFLILFQNVFHGIPASGFFNERLGLGKSLRGSHDLNEAGHRHKSCPAV